MAMELKHQKKPSSLGGQETSRPPPPYSRQVVSPKLAALRTRVQTKLVGISTKKVTVDAPLLGHDSASAPTSIPDGAHCSVVFRGPLWMPTMDPTGGGPTCLSDDNSSHSSKSTDDHDTSAFVLCTVQEIVQPTAHLHCGTPWY